MNIKHTIYFPDGGFKKIGFKIQDVTLSKLKGGWLTLTVNWDCKDCEHYKVKYGSSGGTTYGFSDVGMSITFPQLKYRFRNKEGQSFVTSGSLDIGLKTKNGRKINYEPKYFENLKYGVSVYFAPKNWGKISKEIYMLDGMSNPKNVLINN